MRNTRRFWLSRWLVLAALLLLAGIIGVVVNWRSAEDVTVQPIVVTPEVEVPVSEESPQKLAFDSSALQIVVDEWAATVPATARASVVLATVDGEVLAEYNADEPFFTASLYKLFVAYEGYRQVDSGEVDPDETYLGDYSRAECLDLMIRESYSPCAEKLWNELGKDWLTTTLEGYGISDTSMTGLTTTAADTAKMLAMIARGEGLSDSSQEKYLDSMKDQPDLYRRGLPSGLTTDVTVYNKVGWNEQLEWHDAAIVRLGDDREVIVAVLTSEVGTTRIKDLAVRLEETF